MTDTLLLSPNYLKQNSFVDDNVSEKYIAPAIVSSQEIALKQIIGECLLNSLKNKVADKTINDPENAPYKELLDTYIQPFLLYATMERMTIPLAYKTSNFSSATRTDDDKMSSSSFSEVALIKNYWLNERNVYKRELQCYLKKNRSLYPELSSCCDVNLDSSADCGIWLGGKRGKIINRKHCCC